MVIKKFQVGDEVRVSVTPNIKHRARVVDVVGTYRLIVQLHSRNRRVSVPFDQAELVESPSPTARGSSRLDRVLDFDPEDYSSEPSKTRVRSSPGRKRKGTSLKSSSNIQAIEALRFGLVPLHSVREVTVGLNQIEKWVGSHLQNKNRDTPCLAEISGPFGSGKSHTMAAIRAIAIDRGYLTTSVEVDGSRVTLSDPERLLEALWGNLQFGDTRSATPLLDLYCKAIEEQFPAPRVAPHGIDRISDNYSTIRHVMKSHLLDEFGSDIDGVVSSRIGTVAAQVAKNLARHPAIDRYAISLRKMIGKKVDDRPYDFIESLAGHAMIAKLCGYRGLVITIDEFEVEYTGDTKRLERVNGLLEVLKKYLKGELDHEPAPLAIFVASVGQEGHYGDEILTELCRVSGGEPFELRPMESKEYKLLGGKIHELYRSAYGIQAAPKYDIVQKAQDEIDLDYADQESGETRIFIKNLLSRCDAMYGPCGHA